MTTGKGKINLIGIGPGDPGYLTPAASHALSESDVIVGFRAYIQQIECLIAGKEVVSMELGQELERAAAAVDSAYAGKTVAVVSSGDAGIYGMSGPVFRVLTDRDWDGQDPAVETVPGVSAMQAAAAVLGSPLMQDFCAISLSDLLTPWEKIRGRLEAAGQGDFVVALYNPRSQRRQTQLLEAREILLKHRSGDTPVGIVGDAFRPGQRVKITSLQGLEKEAESVDMVTIVVIGNSTTYLHAGKVITPRGYEEKTKSS
ncbi:MAG TPA: precorrin-3B C(17)-methyltransferase [Dehalococcoidia bacterium]|jgi:precorrin-3B C17-methyltransferase|nr:precorrin-3B C(17)-methyltransferase [Dehalococcoidia bacterium]